MKAISATKGEGKTNWPLKISTKSWLEQQKKKIIKAQFTVHISAQNFKSFGQCRNLL